jgi:hypothetical protein
MPTDDEFKLRDLFTIYSRTPCHTHDLLGCTCSSDNTQSSVGWPSEVDPQDSDSDSDVQMGWVVASQVKPVKLEKTVSFQLGFAPGVELSRFISSTSRRRQSSPPLMSGRM